MVTIIDYRVEKSGSGEEYLRLILQSDDLNVVTTEEGGQYVNAPRATIISTISVENAQEQIGKKLPGSIQRIKVDPWIYTNRETGEQRTLNHRYFYNPEGKSQIAEEQAA